MPTNLNSRPKPCDIEIISKKHEHLYELAPHMRGHVTQDGFIHAHLGRKTESKPSKYEKCTVAKRKHMINNTYMAKHQVSMTMPVGSAD